MPCGSPRCKKRREAAKKAADLIKKQKINIQKHFKIRK